MTTTLMDDRQTVAITVSAVVLSVTAIVVSLRLYTRAALVKHIGADDWAVVVAFVLTLACGISVVVGELCFCYAHSHSYRTGSGGLC
jgi:hypothetical protein